MALLLKPSRYLRCSLKFPGTSEQTSAKAIFRFTKWIVLLDDTPNKHALNARITTALGRERCCFRSTVRVGKYGKVFTPIDDSLSRTLRVRKIHDQ
jgi:hypothetical protein